MPMAKKVHHGRWCTQRKPVLQAKNAAKRERVGGALFRSGMTAMRKLFGLECLALL